MTRFKN